MNFKVYYDAPFDQSERRKKKEKKAMLAELKRSQSRDRSVSMSKREKKNRSAEFHRNRSRDNSNVSMKREKKNMSADMQSMQRNKSKDKSGMTNNQILHIRVNTKKEIRFFMLPIVGHFFHKTWKIRGACMGKVL